MSVEERRDQDLPTAVCELSPRMRQIATIVHRSPGVTLKEICAEIDEDVSHFGIRTLVNRMIRRGLLRSRPSGRHSELAYLPGAITPVAQERAVACLIRDVFRGSGESALIVAIRLASSHHVGMGKPPSQVGRGDTLR